MSSSTTDYRFVAGKTYRYAVVPGGVFDATTDVQVYSLTDDMDHARAMAAELGPQDVGGAMMADCARVVAWDSDRQTIAGDRLAATPSL